MSTTLAKQEEVTRQWHLIDATGQTLGRLAVVVSNLIRGRHKPTYTPSVDTGDYVVVINAEKIAVSGSKEDYKDYMFHSGWVGNEKYIKLAEFRQRKPEMPLWLAVKGMMPRNNLSRHMMTKLRIFGGAKHDHEAQSPVPYKFE